MNRNFENATNVCALETWTDFFRNDNSLEKKAQSDEMKQEPIEVLEGVKVQIEQEVDPIT